MLKISSQLLPNDGVRFFLEGRLDRDTVTTLDQTISTASKYRSIECDVSGLIWLDESGAKALQDWHTKRVHIIGGSLYVRHVLEEDSK